jgi:alanyl-tRNA synthetase
MLTSNEIRTRFLRFFAARGHAIIPSASLVPLNDPSVLFNTAGMQPLVPYLLGEPHPEGTRLADSQKCVRTVDIEEIGDNTHATFFEMLGNWSLGDYFKKDAITWSFEFLTSKGEGLGLDPSRLYVTVFGGNVDAPKDEISYAIWKELFEKAGVKGERIYFMTATPSGKEPNWWSPGDNGPCGPDSEMFYDVTGKLTEGMTKEEYMAADDRQEVVEIWNDVFMEYLKKDGKVVGKLDKQNVDTGSGLERVVMVVQGKNNIFATDLFADVMGHLKRDATTYEERSARIIADHLRTAMFLIGDGVAPSNTDQGYILRRLLRRAVRYARAIGLSSGFAPILDLFAEKYNGVYENITNDLARIKEVIAEEETRFAKTLESGIREIEKLFEHFEGEKKEFSLDAKTLFDLYQTHGFPVEMSFEEINRLRIEHGGKSIPEDVSVHFTQLFTEELKKHQDLSRSGSEQKFKGGLADHSPETVRLHTAHHLLLRALQIVLGPEVHQRGSNITSERLRIDFAYPQKMTDEQKKEVERIVNEKITEALPVLRTEMSREEAETLGAEHEFGAKYPERVSVYSVGPKNATPEDPRFDERFSIEFCGGPHVMNTSELGRFVIQKEEAVAQGIRRIKAVLVK